MPVQFRCTRCRGKLSISRRKVGTDVACPKCGAMVTVPSGEAAADELTELLLAARVEGGGRGASAESITTPTLPAAVGPRPSVPAGRPAVKPPVRTLEDMPLFERSDFEKLLDPATRTPDPLPLPLPPTEDDIPDRRTAGTPPTWDPDAIVLSRTTATLLVVAIVVLLGLAFAAGFLVAG